MASKNIHMIINILLYFCLFCNVSQSKHFKKSFPDEVLEKLIGAKKGVKMSGLHEVKTYLTHLGYMKQKKSNDKAHLFDDVFDDSLELAVKRYQRFYKLNVTGVLDSSTVKIMNRPRCGLPDISRPNESFHFPYRYALFPGEPKWPVSRRNLTFSLAVGSWEDAKDPIANALSEWSSVTNFIFNYTENFDMADIKLNFQYIDGPSHVLVQSFRPTDGRVNFDVDENWSANVEPDKFDLQTVGLHELGHVLGLDHSNVPEAIMFPTIGPGIRKGLSSDDITGIKTLYDLKNKKFM